VRKNDLLQQTLAFLAEPYALAYQLSQVLQIAFIRCLDAPKVGEVVTRSQFLSFEQPGVAIHQQETKGPYESRPVPGRTLFLVLHQQMEKPTSSCKPLATIHTGFY